MNKHHTRKTNTYTLNIGHQTIQLSAGRLMRGLSIFVRSDNGEGGTAFIPENGLVEFCKKLVLALTENETLKFFDEKESNNAKE